MRTWIAKGLAVALLFVPAACEDTQTHADKPVRPVLSEIVETQDQQGQVFVGVVDAQIKAVLGFQVLGRLIERNADVGDSVKKDQILARLDSTALEFEVRNAEAQLASRKAELENAELSVQRQTSLRESDATPQSSLEQAEQIRDTARAGVAKARSDLTKARENLGYTVLKSEFDGVVTAKNAEVGQVVSAGQAVITVARPDLRDAVIDVPDWISFAGLDETMPLKVTLQIDPSIMATGHAREITPQSDAATRSQRIRIGLESPPAQFRLGSTVNVILPASGQSSISVPTTAVFERDGESRIWIVDVQAGTVASRPVNVEPISGNPGRFLVRSGLEPGERIVTAGAHSLEEGQQVKVEGHDS